MALHGSSRIIHGKGIVLQGRKLTMCSVGKTSEEDGSVNLVVLLGNDEFFAELLMPDRIDAIVGDNVIQFINATDTGQ